MEYLEDANLFEADEVEYVNEVEVASEVKVFGQEEAEGAKESDEEADDEAATRMKKRTARDGVWWPRSSSVSTPGETS
jgi:hypothetical protein